MTRHPSETALGHLQHHRLADGRRRLTLHRYRQARPMPARYVHTTGAHLRDVALAVAPYLIAIVAGLTIAFLDDRVPAFVRFLGGMS